MRAEERQHTHARHQEIIAEFGRAALQLHGAQVLLDHAVRSAGLAPDAQAVAYYECTVDDNRMVPRSGTGGPAMPASSS